MDRRERGGAKALCVPYEGPVTVERTGELWGGLANNRPRELY